MLFPRTAGFSLLELLLGMSIFLLFLGGVFGLFSRGYQAFHFLQARQSVQGQIVRLKNVLESDFKLTHLRSVGVESGSATVDGVEVDRDQVCCLVLDDWQNSANFSPLTGTPRWNRYAVYQSSKTEQGRLERVMVAPDLPTPYRFRPLDSLEDLSSANILRSQLLSSSVLVFDCQVDRAAQEVVLTIALQEGAGQRGLDQKGAKEAFEAKFRWTPSNTIPRF